MCVLGAGIKQRSLPALAIIRLVGSMLITPIAAAWGRGNVSPDPSIGRSKYKESYIRKLIKQHLDSDRDSRDCDQLSRIFVVHILCLYLSVICREISDRCRDRQLSSVYKYIYSIYVCMYTYHILSSSLVLKSIAALIHSFFLFLRSQLAAIVRFF